MVSCPASLCGHPSWVSFGGPVCRLNLLMLVSRGTQLPLLFPPPPMMASQPRALKGIYLLVTPECLCAGKPSPNSKLQTRLPDQHLSLDLTGVSNQTRAPKYPPVSGPTFKACSPCSRSHLTCCSFILPVAQERPPRASLPALSFPLPCSILQEVRLAPSSKHIHFLPPPFLPPGPSTIMSHLNSCHGLRTGPPRPVLTSLIAAREPLNACVRSHSPKPANHCLPALGGLQGPTQPGPPNLPASSPAGLRLRPPLATAAAWG